jgi:hypothetical protein
MNAKEEFLKLALKLKPLCADISRICWWDVDSNKHFILKCKYTEEEYNSFLESLDFTYGDGYGSQELYGTIWFENGYWAEREEYDGSEWWELRAYPTIPEELF